VAQFGSEGDGIVALRYVPGRFLKPLSIRYLYNNHLSEPKFEKTFENAKEKKLLFLREIIFFKFLKSNKNIGDLVKTRKSDNSSKCQIFIFIYLCASKVLNYALPNGKRVRSSQKKEFLEPWFDRSEVDFFYFFTIFYKSEPTF
jgi:hypothetical protein